MSDELDNDLDLDFDFDDDGDTQVNIVADDVAEAAPAADDDAALIGDLDEVLEDEAVPAEPLPEPTPAPDAPAESVNVGEQALGLTADMPVQLVAVLGKKRITMHDLMQLQQGQIFDLGAPVSQFVDLVANGKLVAKGELVDIDGQLGVRLTKLMK